MTVGIVEIEAAAAVAVVELTDIPMHGIATILDALFLDPFKNRVEFLVADVERVMMGLEGIAIVEVES